MQAGAVTINYVYDPLYRLRQANYSTGAYFHYSYDPVGNRLTQTICSGAGCTPVNTTYVYDDANRLTSAGGVAQTWSDNGNLLSDGTSTYAYDAANRLTSVTQGANTYTFAYNGLDDRLRQTINGTPTNYTLDLNAGLTQVLADGSNTYLYGLGRIGEQQPAGFVYHLLDALGSVRQLTNGAGILTMARSYQPYGSVLSTAGFAATTYGFAGEATDSSGLVHLRARYYAPTQGRFLTADSWPGDERRPLTLNAWNYSLSNPVNYTDPSGYRPCTAVGRFWEFVTTGGNAVIVPDPCDPPEPPSIDDWPRATATSWRPNATATPTYAPTSTPGLVGPTLTCTPTPWSLPTQATQQYSAAESGEGQLGVSATPLAPSGTPLSYKWPLNSRGETYPTVIDPRTGKLVPPPPTNLHKVPPNERVSWDSLKDKDNYIKDWYSRGYGDLPRPWHQYDIHHITPREYGGKNDFWNLVPVERGVHQQQFNSWWTGYEGDD